MAESPPATLTAEALVDSHRLRALFFTEGRELLQRVDTGLADLTRAPDARPALDAVFRAVHSLKGMSATVQLHDVATLLHAFETALVGARAAGVLPPAHARLLQHAADTTRTALDAAESGSDAPHLATLLHELEALAQTPSAASPRAVRDAAHVVRHATAVQGARWRVDVRIADDAAIPSARATVLCRRLARIAAVLRVSPDADVQADDAWDRSLTVWLGDAVGNTPLDAPTIEAAVRGAGDIAECQVAREVVAAESAPAAGTTVRIPASRLDDLLDLVGELVLARDRLVRTITPRADAEGLDALDETSRLVTRLRDAILTSRMVPLAQVFDRFPRHVRSAAQALGKDVELLFEGRELEVDRSLLDELSEPLLHLLRNAIDHGLESPDERRAAGKPAVGRLVVRAARDGAMLAVTVADDGRGVDRHRVAERASQQGVSDAAALADDDQGLLQLLARPGLSTAAQVTELSGRGVGVDAVMDRVHTLGGRVELATATGAGTAVTLRLPLSVAMLRALLVRVADETYAIPLGAVRGTHLAAPYRTAGQPLSRDIEVDGMRFRTVSLRAHLGLPPADDVSGHLIVLDGAGGQVALHVDACTAQQEIVVKPLQKVRGAASRFSGGTILPDGTPSLILDINSLPS